MDVNSTGSCSAVDWNKSSALHNSCFFFLGKRPQYPSSCKLGGPGDRPGHFAEESGLYLQPVIQPKMLCHPSCSVVIIRTVWYPVSEATILSKTITEFNFWPSNMVLTLFCVVDNGLGENESWGLQTSVNGTTFVPSHRAVYCNVMAIHVYSKQMYPKHCVTNRKGHGFDFRWRHWNFSLR